MTGLLARAGRREAITEAQESFTRREILGHDPVRRPAPSRLSTNHLTPLSTSVNARTASPGMPRDEIVRRDIVRNEIPIYGLGGAAGALAAIQALQDQYRDDGRR